MKISEEKCHLLISGDNEYILPKCKKAGRKLSVLVRISKSMTIERRRILIKAFIES